MDTQQFTHTVYGVLVREFGREASVRLAAWDQLPAAEREKWTAALAVAHREIFPHGAHRPAGSAANN